MNLRFSIFRFYCHVSLDDILLEDYRFAQAVWFFNVRDSSTRERAERWRVPFETMKYRRRNVLSFYAYVYSLAVGGTAGFNVFAGFTILQIFPRVRRQTARKAKLDDIADSLVI